MLNMNSPTVQAMMNNLPQGIGNMPVYFGNTPSITTEQQTSQFNTPYPSPKEMLMQAGQQAVYQPTSFAPRNIVGGYNPGYQAAFNGYVNPYMGYGYSGYNYYSNYAMPMDEETRQTLSVAEFNGIDYETHVMNECNLYKRISRTVSKNIGRNDEATRICEDAFNPKPKYPQHHQEPRPKIKPIHIRVLVGDDVVADMPSPDINICDYHLIRNTEYIDKLKANDANIKTQINNRLNQLHQSAPERKMDGKDLFDFFDNVGAFIMDDIVQQYELQKMTNASKLYDKNKFTQRLLENNGLKSKSQTKAIDRFVGRYGFMPDGRPVSPGHDPAIAQSFSYNPATGQYDITPPPQFISNRLEEARMRFINST